MTQPTKGPRERKAGAVRALAEVFRQQLSATAIGLYVAALEDLEPEQVERATVEAARTQRFMPAPAELRAVAGVGEQQITDRAWEVVRGAIRQHGANHAVDFQDRQINATVRRMGGWERLCLRESDWLDRAGAAEFARIYAQERRAPSEREVGRPLIGQGGSLRRVACPWVPAPVALPAVGQNA